MISASAVRVHIASIVRKLRSLIVSPSSSSSGGQEMDRENGECLAHAHVSVTAAIPS